MSSLEKTTASLIPPQGGDARWRITAIGPSGTGFKVQIEQQRKKRYLSGEALKNWADADTGEVIEDGVSYSRSLWFKSVTARRGSFFLENAIQALPIEGVGIAGATAMAAMVGSWSRFLEAISQLEHYEIPSDRDELDLAITFASAEYPELPPAPASPLRLLFEAPGIGIVTMRKIQEWVFSDAAVEDVRAVESLGPIADFKEGI